MSGAFSVFGVIVAILIILIALLWGIQTVLNKLPPDYQGFANGVWAFVFMVCIALIVLGGHAIFKRNI